MVSPRAVRTVLAELWLISAIVVLGISSYYTDRNRSVGAYSRVITFNIVIACLTILYELIYIPGRYGFRGSIISHAVEFAITITLWCIWLADAIAYTNRSRFKYNHCQSPNVNAGSVFDQCSTYKTLLAFVWIAFGLNTLIAIWTVYSAARTPTSVRAGRESGWEASFGDASTGEALYKNNADGAGRPSDVTAVDGYGSHNAEPKVGRGAAVHNTPGVTAV